MKKLILTNVIVILVLSMLLFVGCEDKKNTEVIEIVDLDNVDVQLIDNWDLWAIDPDTAAVATKSPRQGFYNNNRELIGYPYLVEEVFLTVEKHAVTMDGETYDSADEMIGSIHLIDNQLWTEDEDGSATYYYDYFYNTDTGALWFHEDTSADTLWAVDPTVEEDSLGNNLYDADEFMLFFRSGTGPNTQLVSPQNNWLIPDPDEDDLNDMTPVFKWYTNAPVEEFKFQLCTDTLFTEGAGMVYDEIIPPAGGNFTTYEVPDELENFTDYYWRVKADNKDWSEIWFFRTNNIVLLESPGNGSYVALRPTLKWQELDGTNNYTIHISKDINFNSGSDVIETTDQLEYVHTSNYDANDHYYWRVTSDITPGEWSNVWQFYTTRGVSMDDASPMDEETEIELPVEFEWGELANASQYTIQVASDSLFANVLLEDDVNDNMYTESGILEANNMYYWRLDSDVSATWGDTLSFFTNVGVLLDSPENEETNIGMIAKFKWQLFGGGDTQYVIQVDDEDTFTDPIVDSYIYFDGNSLDPEDIMCETASIIEYNDDDDLIEFVAESLTDFDAETMYYWRVQRDTLQWSETWNFTTVASSGATELQEPANGSDSVELLPQLKWPVVSGAVHYRVVVSLDQNFADTLWCNKVVTDNNYTLDDEENETLILAETYYWKAKSDRSGWSDTWGFTVINGIPSNLTIAGTDGMNNPATPNKADMSWNASADDEFENFIIERSLNGTWEEIGVIDADETSFVDFGLDYGSNYSYRVKTEYVRGFSDYSDVATVDTHEFDLQNEPNLVTVDPGSFLMGSESGDPDEMPTRDIELTHMYEMSDTEITNTQYCEVLNWALGMGKVEDPNGSAGPYSFDGIVFADDAFDEAAILLEDDTYIDFNVGTRMYQVEPGMEQLPVNGVTFFGAVAYCNWLSEINGDTTLYEGTSSITRTPFAGVGYRLPTEAEWEFAATNRGTDTFLYSGSDNADDVAWYFGNAGNEVHEVKGKAYNGLEIYDMSGNLWEWCNDIYDEYDIAELTNPIGPVGTVGSNQQVVIRGGSWEFDEDYLRNTNRSNKAADENTQIGFRIVKIHP